MTFLFKNDSRGFSLIELLVASSIFIVASFIGVSSTLVVVDANRNARAISIVMSNLDFALEEMVRNGRTGISYHCGGGDFTVEQDCPDLLAGDSTFAFFETRTDATWVYRLWPHPNGNPGDWEMQKSKNAGVNFSAVTSPEIVIKLLRFYITGTTVADLEQPQALIVIDGFVEPTGHPELRADFALQSTVVQRIPDI
ncbi:MAG: type II secretion system protein [bacterium]|nr:type II secretion system protein [bacterium]MDZ4285243.1 type II secretion system protein [Patescibacteria group bacterium]